MVSSESMEIKAETMQKSKFKRICVFCGSSQGKKSSYQDAAVDLGNELVSRNIDLVYGGGSIGLMGLVSQAVHDGGRHVIGVIPKTLMPKELTGETVGEVRAVTGMHQRKAEMAKHSDAFIALPEKKKIGKKHDFLVKLQCSVKATVKSGYGTLEELLEVITWAQLGIHEKPEYAPCHESDVLSQYKVMKTVVYITVIASTCSKKEPTNRIGQLLYMSEN
ncbi:hypothetical protein HID58_009899 [Brassica napus]|uniref:Cytokinin riboside 5'-monophosphate phosphoribohydrolase n=1 Tax=Brassica napus TaxID=3708 RepID=A0ABQ8DUL4_BRANA|nr:hypothetical protein HID58_009899 [Brassica napus]